MKKLTAWYPSKSFVCSVVLLIFSFAFFTPRLLASQPTAFTTAVDPAHNLVLNESGTAADDHLQLSFDGQNMVFTHAAGHSFAAADSLQTSHRKSTAEPLVIPAASFSGSQIIINGGEGDDTLTIDLSQIPQGFDKEIIFNGEGQNGADTLVLAGEDHFAEALFEFFNEHDGTIQLSGLPLITYTGLEPITSSITAAEITLNYGNSAETITVTDAGGGQTTVDSNIGGEIVTFNNPTTSLTINGGGGNDTLVVDSLAAAYPAALIINGQGGTDTTTVNGALSLTNQNLTITTETINTVVAIQTGSGAMAFNANVINLGAALTGTGALTFDPLTNSTTIGIGGGAGTLNLNDTELAFLTDGFSSITIGDMASGSGSVDIQTAEFRDAISIVGGLVRVNGDLTNVDTADVTLLSRYNLGGPTLELDVSAEISSNGGDIQLNAFDDIHVYQPVTTTGAGMIDVNSNLDGVSNGTFQLFSLLSAGTGGITVDAYFGAITGTMLTSGGDIALTYVPSYLQLRDDITLDTTNNAPAGADVFLDTIIRGRDFPHGLTVNAGTAGTITTKREVDRLLDDVQFAAREIILESTLIVSQNITLTADIITFSDTVAGQGTLLIEPQTAGTAISLGNTASLLNVSDGELALLEAGFAEIVIGNDTAGDILVETAVVNDPLTLITAGTISDATDTGVDLTATSIMLDGIVSPRGTAAGTFAIDGATTFAPNSTFAVDLTGGTSTGPHDQLSVTGAVMLAPTTALTLDLDGYTIHEQAVVTIIAETAGLTGTFSGFPEGTQTNPAGENNFVLGYTDGATLSSAFTLNTVLAGNGSGSVSSSVAGIDCGLDCVENYAFDTLVTLTATAAAGSVFDGWSGACTGFTCTVAMTQTQTVTATFVPETVTMMAALNVIVSGDGSGTVSSAPAGIACDPDCSEDYPLGTVVTLTAVAHTDSTFTGWSGACSGFDCTVAMTQTQTVTATFERNEYINEHIIYLPFLRAPEPFAPITINPTAIPVKPVVSQGEAFYTATIQMPDYFPPEAFYLSASPTLLQPIIVDDILTMMVDGQTVFTYDFSTTGEVLPQLLRINQAVIDQIVGQTVVVTFRDEYDGVVAASTVYLIPQPE